jgi:hypothetical protein
MTKSLLTKNILYSANTWLAFRICEKYYSDKHYVWCTPFFDSDSSSKHLFSLPPSSTPKDIGQRLKNEIAMGDRHSPKIEGNRIGLIKGAEINFANGKISDSEFNEIKAIVEQARFQDFRPLLYVIPTVHVINRLKSVDVSLRAHPLSEEYIIEELERQYFDIISLDF